VKYKTLITSRTAVMYGCQNWSVTNIGGGKLSIFERKILRKIYGPNCVNMVWGIKNIMNCIAYTKS